MAEFQRLGVVGDWAHPYTTMDNFAEAQIARELMKFAANGTLYRGSKPVMWSVVEKTALAEAEVEYEDYVSDTVWVKFPVRASVQNETLPEFPASPEELKKHGYDGVSIVIWTTTPWTLPGNRAISFFAQDRVWTLSSDGSARRIIGRNRRANSFWPIIWRADVFKAARVEFVREDWTIGSEPTIASLVAASACGCGGYGFEVPLLAGDHVTDDTGTGFVHTAPGHGREDFDVWTANKAELEARGINTTIPYTVDADGRFTEQAPGFTGKRVLTEKGAKGDANEAVIKALIEAGMLIARGRLTHQYPHSWRSKKPVIYRNTPQWFIAMDQPITLLADTGKHGLTPSALAQQAIAGERASCRRRASTASAP